MSKQIDFKKLTYSFKNKIFSPINFVGLRGPLNIYKNINNCNISIEKPKENQKQFRSRISEITTGNPKATSKDQLNTTKISKIFMSQQKRF